MAKRPKTTSLTRQVGLRLPQETLDTMDSTREHLARLTDRKPEEVSRAEATVWGFRRVQEILDRERNNS